MARIPRPLPTALALVTAGVLCAVGACSAEATKPQKVDPAPAVEPPELTPPPTETPTEVQPAAPLTEEELALIAADPKDLTPEMRRKRAYARRKQIMQNPDSPTARALNDLVEAQRAGEIDANGGKGVWLNARGTKPTGRPPAGWRPPEESGETKPATETQPAPSAPPNPQ